MVRLEESTPIVQLKVRLLDISPMVLLSASVSLRELHGVLQVSMGWEAITYALPGCPTLFGAPEVQLYSLVLQL